MAKERFTLIFSAENYAKPITYHLVKDFDLKLNILKAEITPGEEGRLLADLEGSGTNLAKALTFLTDEGIKYVPTNKQVSVNKDECIHCGACTAVCFSGAMVMDRDQWLAEFHSEKCIVCGLCIDACPIKAIQIGFGAKLNEN